MRAPIFAVLLSLALIGCGGKSTNRLTASPTPPAPPPLISQTYTISIVGSSTIYAQVGAVNFFTGLPAIAGPVAVLVTDSSGKPVDGVNVAFRPDGQTPPNWGPWGLGDTLSGDGIWTISKPGTGIAAVGFVPAVVGPVGVKAYVIPVVSSLPTPFASSNQVEFTIIGF